MELTLTVPTSLSDITLKQYQRFVKIDKEGTDDIFIKQKMIQIFCDVPLLAVTKMKRKDFTSVCNQIIEVLNEKPNLVRTFKLNDVEYGFIPNLEDDTQLGEYIDLDDYLKDWDNFNKAMAVLYRPISTKRKDKYRITEYDDKIPQASEFSELTMDIVMGALVFFYRLSSQLLIITPKYLQTQLEKNPKAMEVLEQSGVGIHTYINSLEEASLELRKLLPYTLGLR